MKKIYLLIFILFIGLIFTSCEKDDLDIEPNNEVVDDTSDNDDDSNVSYVDGLVISTYSTNIEDIKQMFNSDLAHSIPSSNSQLKNSKSSDGNYILIEDKNGIIDTLGTSDGAKIIVNGIDEIFSINKNYLLFYEGENGTGIDLKYEILNHEVITVCDTIPSDSTTTYTIVDTVYIEEEMWLVYYDTVDVVVDTTYDIHNYNNILYNLNNGEFFDLTDDINVYNDKITNSFNDPFYKNNDKTKFYYLNSSSEIIEVDLNNESPMTNVIYDPDIYGYSFNNVQIFDGNIIYQDMNSPYARFYYITKYGSSNILDNSLLKDDMTPLYCFILNEDLYFVIEDFDNFENDYIKFSYNEINDSIIVEYDRSTPMNIDYGTEFNRKLNYDFSDDNFYYSFDKDGKILVTISKNDFTYSKNLLDIDNVYNSNDNIELQTKMAKFINGFIIYTKNGIYSINTNNNLKSSISTTSIASGYKIKDMNTDDNGNVIFYGKNKSGENIKGIINYDNTIEEIPIEYDSNGAIIENLE